MQSPCKDCPNKDHLKFVDYGPYKNAACGENCEKIKEFQREDKPFFGCGRILYEPMPS